MAEDWAGAMASASAAQPVRAASTGGMGGAALDPGSPARGDSGSSFLAEYREQVEAQDAGAVEVVRKRFMNDDQYVGGWKNGKVRAERSRAAPRRAARRPAAARPPQTGSARER